MEVILRQLRLSFFIFIQTMLVPRVLCLLSAVLESGNGDCLHSGFKYCIDELYWKRICLSTANTKNRNQEQIANTP